MSIIAILVIIQNLFLNQLNEYYNIVAWMILYLFAHSNRKRMKYLLSFSSSMSVLNRSYLLKIVLEILCIHLGQYTEALYESICASYLQFKQILIPACPMLYSTRSAVATSLTIYWRSHVSVSSHHKSATITSSSDYVPALQMTCDNSSA